MDNRLLANALRKTPQSTVKDVFGLEEISDRPNVIPVPTDRRFTGGQDVVSRASSEFEYMTPKEFSDYLLRYEKSK